MRMPIEITMPKAPQRLFQRRFGFGLLGAALTILIISRTHFFRGWVDAVLMCVCVSFGSAMSAIIWPKVRLTKANQPAEPEP